MLVNQLHSLEDFLSQPGATEKQLINLLSAVSKTWEDAAFSVLPHHSLLRYFNHQLEGLISYLDHIDQSRFTDVMEEMQLLLLKQIDHLSLYYAAFFNWDAFAPVAYHQQTIGRLATTISLLRRYLISVPLSPPLSRCLLHWLDEATECTARVRYTFRSLQYLEKIAFQMSQLDVDATDFEANLIELLSRLNFNHLAFLAFRQGQIKAELQLIHGTQAQLNFLQEQKAAVLPCPEARHLVYDCLFPSLKTMLTDWINEQITLFETVLKKELEAKQDCHPDKQSLDLSVAHLACLIKLFLEENIFVSRNTKAVFRFFAANYQTKRQSAISAGSLSKEFYSIDQHTAARVRDMLQKMILRINRNFFPVMVAIGTAIFAHPGTH